MDSELLLKFIGYFQRIFGIVAYAFMLFFSFGQPLSYTFIHPPRVYYEVGRALHRHRRGHGFESRSSLNFFQAFFSQLIINKLRKLSCDGLSFVTSFMCSSNEIKNQMNSTYFTHMEMILLGSGNENKNG